MQPGLRYSKPCFLLVLGAHTKDRGTFQAKMLEKACRSKAPCVNLAAGLRPGVFGGEKRCEVFWGGTGSLLASGSAPFSALPHHGVPCMKTPSACTSSGCTHENRSVGQQILTWYLRVSYKEPEPGVKPTTATAGLFFQNSALIHSHSLSFSSRLTSSFSVKNCLKKTARARKAPGTRCWPLT